MSFEKLNLIEPIMKALKVEGYVNPTPIQEKAIPIILEGKDILGCAQTGTGKTAAFAIPVLQNLYKDKNGLEKHRMIKSLILTPTRELAVQIGESFESYGKYTGLKHGVIFGGVSQKPQTDKLKSGIDILIATPGRLLDLVNQKYIKLHNINLFVLDEADRMLDMGFINDVKKIISLLPVKKQTLFFSATMPEEVSKLANILLNDPVTVAITPVSSSHNIIDQSIYFVKKADKKSLLIHLLKDQSIISALVFTRTKHRADRVVKEINFAGIPSDVIHGNKSQNARQKALSKFKSKNIRVLVATDIASRGIDIDELTHVINFDLPEVPETYVHRIGRTGRAGLSGTAISFCDDEEKSYLKNINRLISKPITVIAEHPYPVGKSSNIQQVNDNENNNNSYNSFKKNKFKPQVKIMISTKKNEISNNEKGNEKKYPYDIFKKKNKTWFKKNNRRNRIRIGR